MEGPGTDHRSVEPPGQYISVGGEWRESLLSASFVHDFARAGRERGSEDGEVTSGAVEEGAQAQRRITCDFGAVCDSIARADWDEGEGWGNKIRQGGFVLGEGVGVKEVNHAAVAGEEDDEL